MRKIIGDQTQLLGRKASIPEIAEDAKAHFVAELITRRKTLGKADLLCLTKRQKQIGHSSSTQPQERFTNSECKP